MSPSAIDALPRRGEQVVVTVAHPDDESFGCGSLIALAASSGAHVTVICATRGEAGARSRDPATDHLPLGAVREAELRAAARALGVEHVEVLDYADSGFDGPLPANSLCATPVERLAQQLQILLDEFRADVVLTIDGSDGHRDHAHVRDATLQAVRQIERPIRIVQSCLPNSLMRRWIEETRALSPDAVYLDLDLDSLGRPDAELTRVDTSAQLAAREAAIACHRSQRSPYDGLSAGLRRAFLTNDFIVAI
jgi:LmbE family N-acetylglucosaminyl deacetylase